MEFQHFLGNEKIKAQLSALVDGGRLPYPAAQRLMLCRGKEKFRMAAGILMVCAVSCAGTGAYRTLTFEQVRKIRGQSAALSGEICQQPEESGGRYYYVIRTESLVPTGSLRDYGRITRRLSSQTPLDARKYDRITISKAYLFAPQGGIGYSSQAHYESRGIALTGTFSSYGAIVQKKERPWYAFADTLHEQISNALHVLLPQQASGLACGVWWCLGCTFRFLSWVCSGFCRSCCGASGWQRGFVCRCCCCLWRLWGLRRRCSVPGL